MGHGVLQRLLHASPVLGSLREPALFATYLRICIDNRPHRRARHGRRRDSPLTPTQQKRRSVSASDACPRRQRQATRSIGFLLRRELPRIRRSNSRRLIIARHFCPLDPLPPEPLVFGHANSIKITTTHLIRGFDIAKTSRPAIIPHSHAEILFYTFATLVGVAKIVRRLCHSRALSNMLQSDGRFEILSYAYSMDVPCCQCMRCRWMTRSGSRSEQRNYTRRISFSAFLRQRKGASIQSLRCRRRLHRAP